MNRANNALHVRPESSDVAMNEPVSCDLIITFGSRIMLCQLGVNTVSAAKHSGEAGLFLEHALTRFR